MKVLLTVFAFLILFILLLTFGPEIKKKRQLKMKMKELGDKYEIEFQRELAKARRERRGALEIERDARQDWEEILKNQKHIKREVDAEFYDIEKINYFKDKGKDGEEILGFHQEPLIELSIAKRLSGIWKLQAEGADKLWDEIKESEPLKVRNKLLQEDLEYSDSRSSSSV